eukprot:scaffold72682_cov30-Tisochrysis_lutea.AAC.1
MASRLPWDQRSASAPTGGLSRQGPLPAGSALKTGGSAPRGGKPGIRRRGCGLHLAVSHGNCYQGGPQCGAVERLADLHASRRILASIVIPLRIGVASACPCPNSFLPRPGQNSSQILNTLRNCLLFYGYCGDESIMNLSVVWDSSRAVPIEVGEAGFKNSY